MDIGTEIERITVEPLNDPIPYEQPAPSEAPEVEARPAAPQPVRNLLTHSPQSVSKFDQATPAVGSGHPNQIPCEAGGAR